MSAATWDDLGPEARVLRDVMRSRAFGAVSAVAGRKFQVPPPSLPFAIAEPPASPTAARGS